MDYGTRIWVSTVTEIQSHDQKLGLHCELLDIRNLMGCLLRIATATPQRLRRLMAVDDRWVSPPRKFIALPVALRFLHKA